MHQNIWACIRLFHDKNIKNNQKKKQHGDELCCKGNEKMYDIELPPLYHVCEFTKAINRVMKCIM